MTNEQQGCPEIAELFHQIADEAAVNPRWWEAFVTYRPEVDGWRTPRSEGDLLRTIPACGPDFVRRKPQMRMIFDQVGEMYEFPEPVREEPEYGTKYWLPYVSSGEKERVIPLKWSGDHFDLRLLERGVVHLSKEAARAHAIALIKASGGEVEGEDG